MANYQSLKAAINAVIKANGNKEITGTVLNEVLLAMVNSLGAGYQFAGVATPSTNPGTPDQKVFYIASQAGTYTNFNGAVVSDGIAIFEWNGTWTTETLDLSMAGQVQSDWTETDTTKKSYIKHKPNIPPSANVDPTPTEDSPNAVSSGGTYDMIVNTAVTLFGDIQDATNVNAIESVDGKIYNDYQAGDIFFIVDNNVRKYRVALVAGTADSEHPVTISPVNFYYALNSADAINLSLTLKTVSTEQQSLSTKQKAQARTNIAAVSYDAQTLNATEKVQAQNNVFGKVYAPAQNSGLGKVYLDKNNGVLTQAMMPVATQEGEEDPGRNTVYVIQYDYTMSDNITVPAGCTLQFDGGSIANTANNSYRITGDFVINSPLVRIFDNVVLGGYSRFLHSKWFCYADGVTDDTQNLQNTVDSSENVILDVGIHRITNTVTFTKYIKFVGTESSGEYTGSEILFDATSGTAIRIVKYESNPYFTMMGIRIAGLKPENAEYYNDTVAIDCTRESYAPCMMVDGCTFERFQRIFYATPNSYYNRFDNLRCFYFDVCFYNFNANNLKLSNSRITAGNRVFQFIIGDGPVILDKCSFEGIYNHVVFVNNSAGGKIGKLTMSNCYVEITDAPSKLVGDNTVIFGSIDNLTVIDNELQVNSVFRPFWTNGQQFISIGNHFKFNKNGTRVNIIYYASASKCFICMDTFEMSETETSPFVDAYQDRASEVDSPVVMAYDPVFGTHYTSSLVIGSTRPSTDLYIGRQFYDKIINKPIWYNGTSWVDSTGTTV